MTAPRPLPNRDRPYAHHGWGQPNDPDLGAWVALAAATILAAWAATAGVRRWLR